MNKRTVIDPKNLSFEPFDNYGEPIKGMSWHKISYDKEKGQGSYILKMDPGSKSVPHEHVNYEEFYMLEGELIDADGKVFKKGGPFNGSLPIKKFLVTLINGTSAKS